MAKVELSKWQLFEKAIEGEVEAEKATYEEWSFIVGPGTELFDRLSEMPTRLEHVTSRIFQGLKTSADKIYIVRERERTKDRCKIYSPQKDAEYWVEPDLFHPLIKGGDSHAYHLRRTNRLILFPYESHNGKVDLISASEFERRFPLSWVYLLDNRDYLENRERGKMRGNEWYAYSRNQALDVMPLPKIFTPDIAPKAAYSIDEMGDVFFTGGTAGGYGILIDADFSRLYLLGLLNSNLLEWFIQKKSTQMKGGWYSFESRYIKHLPIRPIDFDDPADVARHDRMVQLVEQMLDLHQRRQAAQTEHDRTSLTRRIHATDRQIDALVYELYSLTDTEIEIVEAATQ